MTCIAKHSKLSDYMDIAGRGDEDDITSTMLGFESHAWSLELGHCMDMLGHYYKQLIRTGMIASIRTLLKIREGGLVTAGIPCSSYVFINRFTSQRSREAPLGDETKPHVASANTWLVSIWVHQSCTSYAICIYENAVSEDSLSYGDAISSGSSSPHLLFRGAASLKLARAGPLLCLRVPHPGRLVPDVPQLLVPWIYDFAVQLTICYSNLYGSASELDGQLWP